MDKVVFFWSGWEPIIRILLVGTITYIAIVILLKISGKRTFTKMTAFDFVVAIAIGSAYGRILTAKTVSVSESITTFVLLILLQTIFSFFEVRSRLFKRFTTPQPTLLYYHGKMLEKNMKKVSIRRDELLSAVRKKGFGKMDELEVIIFETDGSFSIIPKSEAGKESTYNELLEE